MHVNLSYKDYCVTVNLFSKLIIYKIVFNVAVSKSSDF